MSRRPRQTPFGKDLRNRQRMAPGGQMWSESPLNAPRLRPGGIPGVTSCIFNNLYIPSADNNWSLVSMLGSPDSTSTVYGRNAWMKFALNGYGGGALGDGDPQDLGVVFDPHGAGNYEIWDFVAPGSPWEGYTFEITRANGSKDVIVGSNTWYPDYDHAKVWVVNPGYHYVTQYGTNSVGWVVCQYVFNGNRICISMVYANSTGASVSVKAMRGTDPDQDKYGGGSYSTYNYRGWNGVDKTTNAAGWGVASQYVVEITADNTEYPHNAGVVADWPADGIDYPEYVLTGPNDSGEGGYADYGICVAWDIGTLSPGQYAHVVCYYTISLHPDGPGY